MLGLWLITAVVLGSGVRKQPKVVRYSTTQFSGLGAREAMMTLINPVQRAEPFDIPIGDSSPSLTDAAGDTVCGQLISRSGNRMQRFEGACSMVELVVFDDAERPQFDELLFGRRCHAANGGNRRTVTGVGFGCHDPVSAWIANRENR